MFKKTYFGGVYSCPLTTAIGVWHYKLTIMINNHKECFFKVSLKKTKKA